MQSRWISRAVLGVFVFAMAGASARECERIVVTADPDYPPLHWYDGRTLRGASIDVVTSTLSRLGLPYEVRYVGPFSRVLRMAEIGEIDIVTTLKITPEREVFLTYAPTPAFTNPVAVFTLRANNFPYQQWSDPIGKRGGITLGNKFGGGFDEYMTSKLNVESANRMDLNFAKLKAGRIDYFITGRYAGLAYLAQNDLEGEFVAQTTPVTETKNYVAFSKLSPCLKHLPSFEHQLAELVRSGKVRDILEENLAHFRKTAP